ncbi:hypothetical protein AWL63_06285 [Sphingomonas panacis]|uniref:Uncharacterized protein n=1 Tax=Sphingomonas panacis TaxID=1560345 RepID=A0A1B3Z896_9SPHN|nr:hypothetical protein [Sphingomonas panacis]AOH83640.1 hypothetical protein AWL63_06285 [Sphingomonas panacis]
MTAETDIANIRADLKQISDALDNHGTAFGIGLLHPELKDALRSLSRATDDRPSRPERGEFWSQRELLVNLVPIRTRLENCLLSGTLHEADIIGAVGPALHHVAGGIVDLMKTMARSTPRTGTAG